VKYLPLLDWNLCRPGTTGPGIYSKSPARENTSTDSDCNRGSARKRRCMVKAPVFAIQLPKTLHSAVTLGSYVLGNNIFLPKLPCLIFFCLNIQQPRCQTWLGGWSLEKKASGRMKNSPAACHGRIVSGCIWHESWLCNLQTGKVL